MCYESDNDELMDAVPLELQIQICVGEAAGAPMLSGDNLTWLRLEFGTDLATPGAVFEAFSPPSCPLDRRNIAGQCATSAVPNHWVQQFATAPTVKRSPALLFR